jgi:hypothetical protein
MNLVWAVLVFSWLVGLLALPFVLLAWLWRAASKASSA